MRYAVCGIFVYYFWRVGGPGSRLSSPQICPVLGAGRRRRWLLVESGPRCLKEPAQVPGMWLFQYIEGSLRGLGLRHVVHPVHGHGSMVSGLRGLWGLTGSCVGMCQLFQKDKKPAHFCYSFRRFKLQVPTSRLQVPTGLISSP